MLSKIIAITSHIQDVKKIVLFINRNTTLHFYSDSSENFHYNFKFFKPYETNINTKGTFQSTFL